MLKSKFFVKIKILNRIKECLRYSRRHLHAINEERNMFDQIKR
jgi:hypothetical protein